MIININSHTYTSFWSQKIDYFSLSAVWSLLLFWDGSKMPSSTFLDLHCFYCYTFSFIFLAFFCGRMFLEWSVCIFLRLFRSLQSSDIKEFKIWVPFDTTPLDRLGDLRRMRQHCRIESKVTSIRKCIMTFKRATKCIFAVGPSLVFKFIHQL